MTHNPIRKVTTISNCRCCRPTKPRVIIEFENGQEIEVHDDGSFIDWTGETGD